MIHPCTFVSDFIHFIHIYLIQTSQDEQTGELNEIYVYRHVEETRRRENCWLVGNTRQPIRSPTPVPVQSSATSQYGRQKIISSRSREDGPTFRELAFSYWMNFFFRWLLLLLLYCWLTRTADDDGHRGGPLGPDLDCTGLAVIALAIIDIMCKKKLRVADINSIDDYYFLCAQFTTHQYHHHHLSKLLNEVKKMRFLHILHFDKALLVHQQSFFAVFRAIKRDIYVSVWRDSVTLNRLEKPLGPQV